MKIEIVYAAVSVADIEASIDWYAKVFGRPFDERPMKEAAEWKLGAGGVQLVLDRERAGKSMVTIGVADIEALVAELGERGIQATATAPGEGPFRLAQLKDADGNQLTFAQDQRTNKKGA
jgi:predicted enzyme related to lactoylglutathione lyase